MPRLLIVSAHYPPNPVGGAEIVAHRQAKRLEADGWRTEVFAGRYDPSEAERDESVLERENYDGLRIHRTPLSSIQLGGNFRSRRHAAQFAQVLSEFRPDVAHFHNITGLGVNLVGVARRAGVRTVVTLHDYWGFCLKNVLLRNDLTLCADHDACHECVARVATPDGLLPVRLRRDYVMRELGQADAFIAPSNALAENYAQAGLDLARIATFSAGVDLQSFPQPTPAGSRAFE
ncbi:MAG TPA: glycosyltransferase [Methylocystis sp.]|nr:glycosyltransferase [Methylocystis sp.]